MEDKDSSNFCSNCGAPMRDSDTFCSSCGTTVGKSAASTQQYGNSKPKSKRLTIVVVLAAIWALIALAIGLYIILSTDALLAQFDSTPNFWDIWYDAGFTRGDMYGIFQMMGAIIAASGALAALTAILSAVKRFYILALIACILSSLLVITALIGIVGLIVAYLIYKAKDEFIVNKTV